MTDGQYEEFSKWWRQMQDDHERARAWAERQARQLNAECEEEIERQHGRAASLSSTMEREP